jgi:[ribosomal protein S5]-alanine N-acetyltransferase
MKHMNDAIDTERLRLIPLTYEHLVMYLRLDGALERSLGAKDHPRIISPDLQDALARVIVPAVTDQTKDYLYSTLWTLMRKEDCALVGDLCFFGEPNVDGEIEIGYGTYEDFRNHGYMSEAVGAMARWALRREGVRAIVAGAEKTNPASYRVLEKTGFVRCAEVGTQLRFRIEG